MHAAGQEKIGVEFHTVQKGVCEFDNQFFNSFCVKLCINNR